MWVVTGDVASQQAGEDRVPGAGHLSGGVRGELLVRRHVCGVRGPQLHRRHAHAAGRAGRVGPKKKRKTFVFKTFEHFRKFLRLHLDLGEKK